MAKPPRRRIQPGKIAQHRKEKEATAEPLRQMFNASGILENVKLGLFTVRVLRENDPLVPLEGEPPGIKSQLLAYFDENGDKIAEAHQYVRPDGSLAASGMPDPKKLHHNGIVYHVVDQGLSPG